MEEDKNYYTPEELEKILQEHNISMEDFGEFIYGQGCPLVDGVPCYFVSDVNRFVEAKTYRQKHIRMIADMLKAAAEDDVVPTENLEKVARARVNMNIPITVCPCAAKEKGRGCIGPKCFKEIEETGTCCCKAFKRRNENGKSNKSTPTL